MRYGEANEGLWPTGEGNTKAAVGGEKARVGPKRGWGCAKAKQREARTAGM